MTIKGITGSDTAYTMDSFKALFKISGSAIVYCLKRSNKNNAVCEIADGSVEEKIGLQLKNVSHPKLQHQRS